jgi:hypothetical protein
VIRRDLIVIALSPTYLRVGSVEGGKLGNVCCMPLEPGSWDQAWQQGLRPLDAALQEALQRIGANKGAKARVIYHSPKAGAEVLGVPAEGETALRAAALSFKESLPGQDGAWPHAMRQLHRDASAGRDNESPKTHVLVAFDGSAETNAIAAWLMRAKLGIGGLVPARAAALALCARAATQLPTNGTHAVLWMGDHVTTLAGWNNGRLLFARAVDFGCWMLTDSIMRGAQAQGVSGVDRTRAQDVLFGAGLPRRGQVMDAELNLNADSVLPLAQPVVQRYAVETRQTLRFGIPETDLVRTTLHLAGPGAAVPNLGPMLEPSCSVAVEVLEGHASLQMGQIDAGELTDLLAIGGSDLDLVPQVESDRRVSGWLRASLQIGAAAALLGLGALAGWTHVRSEDISHQKSLLEQRTQAMLEHEKVRGQADKLAADLAGATKSIKEALGERPRWLAGLAYISRACGESIELTHIAGSFPVEAGGSPVMTLSGNAYASRTPRAPTDRSDSLGAFLERLSKSPVVASAKIVSSHADTAGGDSKSFVISIQLKSQPADPSELAAGSRPAPERKSAQVQEPNQ